VLGVRAALRRYAPHYMHHFPVVPEQAMDEKASKSYSFRSWSVDYLAPYLDTFLLTLFSVAVGLRKHFEFRSHQLGPCQVHLLLKL